MHWLDRAWHLQARTNQRPELGDWRTWLLLGGRGSGKTRTGAEWIKAIVAGSILFPGDGAGRIALVGGSFADVRDVMIEGESGLLAIHDKGDRPNWLSSKRQLEWSNGTIGYAFSSEDPEQLRGSQFGAAW
ncbi:MAG: terminase family protein, partial [Rhizobiaceae bacterium]